MVTSPKVRLRCFELEMNRSRTEAEEMKMQRYHALLYPGRPPLSADAWQFWQRVRKAGGIERRDRQLLELQTQEAENWP